MVRIGGKGITRERDRIQENTSKCIIRNCPCIKHYDDIKLDNRCMSNEYIPLFCENNPDCVIKQIIELCNNEKEQETDPLNSLRIALVQKILNLFDMEEVNK